MANSIESMYEKYSARGTFGGSEEDTYINTGSIILDAVLSDGKGMPLANWIQYTGPTGCGKTTSILHCAKAFCARGLKVIYLDVEKGVNQSQLNGIGLSDYLGKQFFLFPVSTFEECEEILESSLGDDKLALICCDSITAMIPEKVLEKSISEVEPGLNARYAAAFITKFRALISRSESKPTVVLINQERVKLNFRGMSTVGAAGGNAQKYYTDIHVMMKEDKALEKTMDTMEGKKTIKYGSNVRIWCTKNRHNAPFLEGIMTIIFGKGVSNIAAYQRALMGEGVMSMSGAGYWTLKLPDKEPEKARGNDGAMDLIRKNLPEIKKFIESVGGLKLLKTDEEED